MANAPPTPPATTPAELQDEAQASTFITETPAAAPVQVDVQMRLEIYSSVGPAMAEAIMQKNYNDLVRIGEETDIVLTTDHQPTRLLIVAPLVLGHLINDNIPPARYALERLPDNLSSHPLYRALSSLVNFTQNRQHARLYEQAITLTNVVSQPDFFDKDLASMILALTSVFLESFRQRTFELLSKAYTSLPSSLASIYLGLPVEQILNVTEKFGWSYEPSTQILSPRHNPKGTAFGTPSPNGFSSLNTFHFVADSVARLES